MNDMNKQTELQNGQNRTDQSTTEQNWTTVRRTKSKVEENTIGPMMKKRLEYIKCKTERTQNWNVSQTYAINVWHELKGNKRFYDTGTRSCCRASLWSS